MAPAQASITARARRSGSQRARVGRDLAIIEAAYFEDLPSKDVGEEFGETYDNVDQIKKRFRTELRAQLVARGVWET